MSRVKSQCALTYLLLLSENVLGRSRRQVRRIRQQYEITIEYKQRPLEYSIYCEQEQQQAKVIKAELCQFI